MTDTIKPGSLATFAILYNGKAIPSEDNVYSLKINQLIGAVDTAEIMLLDGDPASGHFAIAESKTFEPGVTILIQLGYDAVNKTVFEGTVTSQTIMINNEAGPA